MQEIEQTKKSYEKIKEQWKRNLEKGKRYNAATVRRATKSADAPGSVPEAKPAALPYSSLSTDEKIKEFRKLLKQLEHNVKDDPGSIKGVNFMLNRMYAAMNDVPTEEEIILSMIKSGESQTVEFKETLKLPVDEDGTPKKFTNNQELGNTEISLQEGVLKNIVAFLNTDGGYLFIGVNDKGDINGIDKELKHYKWTIDFYLQHITHLIRDQIGLEYTSFIDQDKVLIENKTVIKFACKPSSKPCFLRKGKKGEKGTKEVFFVRLNPAAEPLEGSTMAAYIEDRFLNK